jgi:hypothetical protein
MTRREQFIRSRAWLKKHTFVITNSLREKLQGVPLEDREGYCYIQNLVLILASEFEQEAARINSSIWKDKLGTRYTVFTTQMKQWGELDVDEDYQWSTDKSGYPMGYAVPPSALETGTCLVDFERKRIRLPRPNNKPTDDVSEFALECLSQLRVAETLAFPAPEDPSKNPDVRRARIRWHCEHIAGKDFSLRYGKKVKRLFHRVLLMPREGRRNLTYWCPLAEYDVRACHPLLMLKLFKDPGELSQYAAMLTKDIYTVIMDEMGMTDRQQVKDDFQRVVNISHKTADWMAKQYVFQFYHSHFPTFAEQVLFMRKDLAEYLQSLEARLMVERLGTFCREQNLLWIPMHDGFIARIDQGEVIAQQARRIIKAEVGLAPHIQCTPLGN